MQWSAWESGIKNRKMLGRIYSDVLLDYTSSRGDDDEAGDHALHGTDHGWLAEEDDVQ